MLYCVSLVLVFFFKQKTAYEMRISDWSSDVCSSDLGEKLAEHLDAPRQPQRIGRGGVAFGCDDRLSQRAQVRRQVPAPARIGQVVEQPAARPARHREHQQVRFAFQLAKRQGADNRLADIAKADQQRVGRRSEEHTSELQSLMRTS